MDGHFSDFVTYQDLRKEARRHVFNFRPGNRKRPPNTRVCAWVDVWSLPVYGNESPPRGGACDPPFSQGIAAPFCFSFPYLRRGPWTGQSDALPHNRRGGRDSADSHQGQRPQHGPADVRPGSRSAWSAYAADVARLAAQPGAGERPPKVARRATGQILIQLPQMAHARGVWTAIRSIQPRLTSHSLLAAVARFAG